MENLCSEILTAETRSTFYPKNIFVGSDTILSSSPAERKQLQLSVYHFNIITFFFTSSAETVIFHTNVIATTRRSSLFLPFLKSSLLFLNFKLGHTHTSRKWCHVIWQTDTNVAQETAVSVCSSQHPVKCFPWHCLLQNISHLFSFLKSLFSLPLVLTHFLSFFFQHNKSHGWITALVSLLRALFLEITTLTLLPWKRRQLVPHKHWHLCIKLHSVIPHDSNIDSHLCENLKLQ